MWTYYGHNLTRTLKMPLRNKRANMLLYNLNLLLFMVSYLQMFHSAHYAGQPLCAKFRNGEPWKKIFGPVLVYLNSAAIATTETLWKDAKDQVM